LNEKINLDMSMQCSRMRKYNTIKTVVEKKGQYNMSKVKQ